MGWLAACLAGWHGWAGLFGLGWPGRLAGLLGCLSWLGWLGALGWLGWLGSLCRLGWLAGLAELAWLAVSFQIIEGSHRPDDQFFFQDYGQILELKYRKTRYIWRFPGTSYGQKQIAHLPRQGDSQPSQPSRPSQLSQPSQPSQPGQSSQLARPAKLAQPAQPVQIASPASPDRQPSSVIPTSQAANYCLGSVRAIEVELRRGIFVIGCDPHLILIL